MNRWLRLIAYGLCSGTTWKLLVNLSVPRPSSIPSFALSVTLFGWLSLLFCPFVVFLNRHRIFDNDDVTRLSQGRVGIISLLISLALIAIPMILGHRHLWWLGLIVPMIASEAILSPTKPWEMMDVFDHLLNRADQKAGRT
jgi:hypothetical protein